jgi:arsenic resistance protein ArsH
MWQLFKFTVLLRPHTSLLTDRYSERMEVEKQGRLLSQAEKEAQKKKDEAAAAAAKATPPSDNKV